MRDFLRSHCGNRLFEWIMAFAMILLAVHVTAWPASIEASAFRYLLFVFWPSEVALVFFAFGLARMLALIANGTWPNWGPKLRAGCAFGGAMMWGQMDFALLTLIPNVGTPPSPGIPVYFALVLGELASCYRVLAFSRYERPAHVRT